MDHVINLNLILLIITCDSIHLTLIKLSTYGMVYSLGI